MQTIESTPNLVEAAYKNMWDRVGIVRGRLNRPLTLAEKILYGHLNDPDNQKLEPGTGYLQLRPDRVAMQDATAQMALLQFMLAGRSQVAIPTTVHCDHLIRAFVGADADLQQALLDNNEVYAFLKSVSSKYGIGFWAPGSGIIHQVLLENYAFPGGLMIGTDSHTPNAGGLGMLAVGVGGADAVDVMVDFPWEVLHPKILGIRLTGKLQGWTAPKDIILKVAGILTTSGGTNRIVEYFGPGSASLACTGKATITNMGAELGATTSVFPYDSRMADYLRATERDVLAAVADTHADLLTADQEVLDDPTRYFDDVIEIDLSQLEPHVVGPHRPDLARPVSQLGTAVTEEGYSDEISAVLVGSCTNSSYEDISRAASLARQAKAHGAKAKMPFLVTPGSEMVRATTERDGQLEDLESIGAVVLANACGPCIGQWKREDISPAREGDPPRQNSIVSSFNRNFPSRNDGSPNTQSFISSPELAVAFALSGRLSSDPTTSVIHGVDSHDFKLEPPEPAPDIPPDGFVGQRFGYSDPSSDSSSVSVAIDPNSDRLEALAAFQAREPEQFRKMPVLLKATGQCTTDAISPAGRWLRYRGHLTNISDNMFVGANNAFGDESGTGYNIETGEDDEPLADIAKHYKKAGITWVAVGDKNYGEGSSREHAAMSPRHTGGGAIIVRSFARIHEANLKKQGMLPLTFNDPADFDRVRIDDQISVVDIEGLAPDKPLTANLEHSDGSVDTIQLNHTLNADQIRWFWAGSALNLIRAEET
jgi:aconitate hydratase